MTVTVAVAYIGL